MKTKVSKNRKQNIKVLAIDLDTNLSLMKKYNTHFNNHLSDFYSDLIRKGFVLLGSIVAVIILIV